MTTKDIIILTMAVVIIWLLFRGEKKNEVSVKENKKQRTLVDVNGELIVVESENPGHYYPQAVEAVRSYRYQRKQAEIRKPNPKKIPTKPITQ